MSHADEFKQLHEYYTTQSNNPLKKMQSLVVIACKILRGDLHNSEDRDNL